MGFFRAIGQRFRSIDFYKKLPQDLAESTFSGAGLSIIAGVLMVFLFAMEMQSFLQTKTSTDLVVDRSSAAELLRINFNISFPSLSCEFATLDVSDNIGAKRINLTKTVRKTPIDINMQRTGLMYRAEPLPEPKYDDEETHKAIQGNMEEEDYSIPLTAANFEATVNKYPIVFVNFFAPWCPWCQRLAPTWETVTQDLHKKYPEEDGRIRLAKVDCTQEEHLCRVHHIQGFPSLRVFRKGKDDIYIHGIHDHESYHGDRSREALENFAESMVASAGEPQRRLPNLLTVPKGGGCNIGGFVLVKKVPGTLHFLAKSKGHSFDHARMNMTHIVHSYYYGIRPSPRRAEALSRLHPGWVATTWSDKLQGRVFISYDITSTHEHFLQVVLTTIKPIKRSRFDDSFDAYEYIVHSHTYNTDNIPSTKFSYELSPIQIVVKEEGRQYYHFLTTTCAIVGGIFTVAGILDGILFQGYNLAFKKKMELGKHT